jgi:hypothetical protein
MVETYKLPPRKKPKEGISKKQKKTKTKKLQMSRGGRVKK